VIVVVIDVVVDVNVDVDVTVVVVDVDVDVDVTGVVVDVDVNVDVTGVVAEDVDVNVDVSGVDIIVVTLDGVVVVVMLSGFVGARMTNFNKRERVTAIIAKTIKEMPMILIQR
jgi:hypothetical protein